MVKSLTLVVASAALLTSLSASAEPQKMTGEMLDQVVAGIPPFWDPCTCWGNNGWGNGEDGNNPGSYAGATAPSKEANGTVLGFGDININPTTSTGR